MTNRAKSSTQKKNSGRGPIVALIMVLVVMCAGLGYFIWKHFPVYFMVEQTPWQKGQIEQVVRVVCIVFCSVPASLSAFCMIP